MEQKFLRCSVCGNILTPVVDSGVPVMCCGKKMEALVPGTVDASHEKHIPVYEVEGNRIKVRIGSVAHPMIPEHHIAWVEIKTKMGVQRKYIANKDEAKVCFLICEHDELEEVYAYCNLHGLWKA